MDEGGLWMRRTFMVSLASALLAVMAVSSAASAASEIVPLLFESRYDVFKFRLEVDDGTRVRADTRDCCFPGDNWGVTLVRPHDFEQSDPKTDTGCSDGSIDGSWSGLATMKAKSGKVIAYVFNCSPTQIEPQFPAGMEVRFRYNGTLVVHPVGGP
jgi:hypothetical protein